MHTLPELGYAHNALEPHFDARTMEIHHGKHHAAYVNNLNNAIKGTNTESLSITELMPTINGSNPAIRNNGGGHYNHTFFWISLKKDAAAPSGNLAEAINNSFGSLASFKEKFAQAATTRFGSGWAWLIKTEAGLEVASTPNQDNPLMPVAKKQGTPLLGLDVWEHSYYLHYQNRRPDYINAFWNVVNWDVVAKRFSQ